eukprot:COSAG01_NODE_52059_length_349_cov_1.244000_1_plen_57_part_10
MYIYGFGYENAMMAHSVPAEGRRSGLAIVVALHADCYSRRRCQQQRERHLLLPPLPP